MNLLKTIALVTSLTATCSALAADNTNKKTHTFGGQLAIGGAQYKNSDSEDVAQFYAYYNFRLNDNYSLEIASNSGVEIDDWHCHKDDDDDWRCNEDNSLFSLYADELEYDNIILAIKGIIPLSRRNSLYGKIGAQYYDYEIQTRNRTIRDDSGTGLFLAAGWQFRWHNGIGINSGIQYLDMGDLETLSATAGISYSF